MGSTTLSTYLAPTSWEFIKEQVEKAQKNSLTILPDELLMDIFGRLHPRDLTAVSDLCRRFRRIGNEDKVVAKSWQNVDLKKEFPKLHIIDESIWKKHIDVEQLGLQFAEAPPMTQEIYTTLKTLQQTLHIEGNAGLTLLTIPQGLSLRKLEMVKTQSNPAHAYFTYWSEIMRQLGDTAVQKTYRVIISNSVLEGSRSQSEETHERIAQELGCEIPDFLTYAALLVLTKLGSNIQLLSGDSSKTYARCKNDVETFNPFLMRRQKHMIIIGNYLTETGLFYLDGPVASYFVETKEAGFGVMKRI